MKTPASAPRPANLRIIAASLSCALAVFASHAADTPASAMSATELAARLSALQQDGASYVRLRLEVTGATKIALQLQIKQHRSKTGSEIVYQVLWPKERKGESVLLRKSGDRSATGTLFRPPDTLITLDGERMKDALFGSDLTYEDIIENFFAWEHQANGGSEILDHVSCQILESKPGKGQHSTFASARTWVDTRRLVPLRVEKYTASGELVRRIDFTKVTTDDINRHIPANLTVRGRPQDSVTELDGSKIRHDVTYTDREFTPEGLKELKPPTSAAK